MLLSLSDFSDLDEYSEYAFGINSLRSGLNAGVMRGAAALTKKRSASAIASGVKQAAINDAQKTGQIWGSRAANIQAGINNRVSATRNSIGNTVDLSKRGIRSGQNNISSGISAARSGINTGVTRTAVALTTPYSSRAIALRSKQAISNGIRSTRTGLNNSITRGANALTRQRQLPNIQLRKKRQLPQGKSRVVYVNSPPSGYPTVESVASLRPASIYPTREVKAPLVVPSQNISNSIEAQARLRAAQSRQKRRY